MILSDRHRILALQNFCGVLMIQWLISRRYYLLTSLTLLLGTLVLVVTLALATASYLRSIDKTVAGYGHMLSS